MATHSMFLPGESHGQRSLVSCSSRGSKESDITEQPIHARTVPFYILSIILNSNFSLKRKKKKNSKFMATCKDYKNCKKGKCELKVLIF